MGGESITQSRSVQNAVIELGEVVMILDLHPQGVSAIARELGLDRNTVRKCIARGLEPPVYGPRKPRKRLIDPFVPGEPSSDGSQQRHRAVIVLNVGGLNERGQQRAFGVAPSLGSDATVALPKTSRRPSPAPRPGS